MAKIVVVYWQDIPSMVEAREGASVGKVKLSDRFQELIDTVAMRKKLVGTDAYLEQWRRVRMDDRPGDPGAVASAIAGELEAQYDAIRGAAIAQLKSE